MDTQPPIFVSTAFVLSGGHCAPRFVLNQFLVVLQRGNSFLESCDVGRQTLGNQVADGECKFRVLEIELLESSVVNAQYEAIPFRSVRLGVR